MTINSPTDVRSELRVKVAKAIPKAQLGLGKMSYDVSFGFVPLSLQQGAPPSLVPVHIIVVHTANPLLGHPPLGHLGFLDNCWADQAQVDTLVMDICDVLRERKAQLLSTQNGGDTGGK